MDSTAPAPPAPAPPTLAPDAALPPRRKTRAQATVEFALIAPVLFALALGIMEFGWLFRSHMTVHFATREGARYGAVLGSQGSPDPTILNEAVAKTMNTMSFDDILEVSIYHSDTTGACIIDVLSGQCQEDAYYYDAATGWQPIPGRTNNWPATNRSDIEPTDILGLRIKYRHRFLINFLPGAVGDVIIDDHSIMSIEPHSFPMTPTP
jgi:Flp pilus assembly protein TadG